MEKIKKILFLSIKLLSCLFIKNKRIYVFGAWFGQKYADNSKEMYLHYLNNSNKKVYWVTKNRNVYNQLKKEGKPVLMYWSLKSVFIHLHAGYGFICTGSDVNLMFMGRATIIQLWHGVGGGKKVGKEAGWYDKRFDKFYYLFNIKTFKDYFWATTSKIQEKIFSESFLLDSSHFFITGQPRNDCFFDDRFDYINFDLPILNSKDKKIILYAPTHRLEGKKEFQINKILDLEKLNEFCEEKKCLFVIKKHFYHKNEILDLSNYNNVIDLTNYDIDINILLMKSDILITDYSSVSTDFLLLDKPMLFYCFDLDEYMKVDRDMYFEYSEITPGYKCKSFDELMNSTKEILKGIDLYHDERTRVRKMFFDDVCLEKSAPRIERFLEDN